MDLSDRPPNYRWLRHDITCDPVEDLGLFDVIHTRLVLSHLGSAAVGTVDRLVGLLAPGGRILIEETIDVGAGDPAHPESEALAADYANANAFTRRFGLINSFGAQVPQLLAGAGLTQIENEISGSMTRGGDAFRVWMGTSIDSMATKLDVTEVFDDPAALRARNDDPTLWFTFWLSLAAWGTKPPAG